MEILRACLNEIALSGLEGCTVGELWQHLSSRQPPAPLKLDEATQSFVWRQLRETVLRNGSVRVYQLPTQRPAKCHVTEREGISGGEKWMEYSHPFPYRPISSEEDGIRGSCATHREREDITPSVLQEEMGLATLATKYGDTAALVASQEVRERALLTDSKPCIQELSTVQYCVLEVVGAARHYGILRTEITKNYLKIDPRSTFHHCKVLESFGLLRIKGTHARRRKSVDMVHLLLLPSYPLPPWVFVSNYPTLISNLLLKAPEHTLPTSYISKTIGKGFKAGRDTLHRGGFAESVLLPKEHAPARKKSKTSSKTSSSSSSAGKKVPLVRHLRLLKPYRTPESEGGEEGEEGEGEEDGGGKVPAVFEAPIDMQGYRVVDRRGPEGINNSVFSSGGALAIGNLTARQLSNTLIRSKDLITILVDEDGIKKLKLVSARHVSKNEEYEKLVTERAKSNFKDAKIGVRTGKEMFQEQDRKMKENSGSGTSDTAATATHSSSHDDSVHLPQVTPEIVSEFGTVEPNEKGSQTDFSVPPPPEPVPGPSQSPHTLVPSGDGTQRDSSPEPVPKPGTKAFSKGRQPLTYHQLRRLNIITKYMEEQQIVVGYADMTDHIRKHEKTEGRTATVDRKTTEKRVKYLLDNGQLCLKQVTLPDSPSLRLAPIIYVPGVCPEKLAAVEEQVVRAATIKRETKTAERECKGNRKGKKRRSREEEEEEGEGGRQEEKITSESDTEIETVPVPNIAGVSKFQRLKHVHLLLWILTHGSDKATPTTGSEVTANEASISGERGGSDFSHPSTNFPWVAMVTQLEPSGRGPGWLCYNDIIPNMPFSLLCMLMPTVVGRGVIPAKFLRYFKDQDYQHTLIHQLPRRLRSLVTAQRHEISLLNQILEKLEEMGLLQVEGNLGTNRKRSQVFLRLLETMTILDTSPCSPRQSFFLESARPLFQPIACTLTSLRDIEHYWYQLQSVCMRTHINLKERIRESKAKSRRRGLQATPTKSATSDHDPLPYMFQNKRILAKVAKAYNQKGFGAGGLSPLFFSHLKRNWYSVASRDTSSGGMEHGDGTGGMGMGENGMEWSYGPGMGLESPQLSFVPMEGEGGERGEESEGGVRERVSGPPPLKKACFDSRPRLQGHVVQIPSHQVQRHSGGRGFQRSRTKKALEVAKRLKKVKTSRYRVSKKTAVLVMDGDGSKEVSGDSHRERARWFPHEDSFLLLAYLASHALRQFSGQATVSFRQISDALHTEYNTSRGKSVNAVQRRIALLRRQRKNLSACVNVCLAEILSEITELGSAAPQPTFPSLLSFVTQRYKSQGGLILGKASTLPSTLSDLHTHYTVVGNTEGEEERKGLPVSDEHAINQAFLMDLIIACLGAEESSYDNFAAFRTFESFPEADLKAAFDALRSKLLIKRRRANRGVPSHAGPLQCQSFQLAANFNNKLEYTYLHGTGSSATKCAENLANQRSKVMAVLQQRAESEEDHCTGDGWCNGDVVIDSGDVCGGVVSCLLATLFSHSEAATCEPAMPKRLFDTDGVEDSEKTAHQLMEAALTEEEEEEMEREGEGEEVEREGEGEGGGEGEGEVEGGEEEEEDKEQSSSKRDSHRFTGMGLSHLLQVDENSTQNHGSVTLDLDTPWLRLVSPLPGETPPPSLDSWNNSWASPNDGETSLPPLSLADYLHVCRLHLNMTEADVHYGRLVYGAIEERGERGVRKGELQEHEALSSSLPHTLSLSDHVQQLLNFEMIMCVGISEERLVTMLCHAHRWCMSVSQSRNGTQTDLVPYRPWVTVNSARPNVTLMTQYRHGILTYIMANPGVTMRRVMDHFSGMLHYTGFWQILQSLEQEGVVRLHTSGASGCDLDSAYCLSHLC